MESPQLVRYSYLFEKKPNSFHDFIAAGEKLIAGNYTSKGNIVIQGGSAGGLLVGATVNMAPELFHAALAGVPFVDVIKELQNGMRLKTHTSVMY